MGKLIYITESQLNEIIGNGAYLNDTDSTNEYRFGGKEISANGVTGDYVDGDVENGEPVTTDKIAKQLTRQGTRGMGRAIPYGYGTNKLRESKKKVNDNLLSEANQDLTGKNNTFQISPKELKKLKERLLSYKGPENDKGVKRVKNIIEKGRISYDDAYRILDDIKNGKGGQILDPEGTLQREIEYKVNLGTDISQSNRDAKMRRGENILKSSPKNGSKGGAHTSNNNIIGITYQN